MKSIRKNFLMINLFAFMNSQVNEEIASSDQIAIVKKKAIVNKKI
jgi:hypothetical protein